MKKRKKPKGLTKPRNRRVAATVKTAPAAKQPKPTAKIATGVRATAALSRAFDANPRNAFIASRLAWQLSGLGQTEKALSILRRALDANGGDKRLHYTYARLLMETNPGDGDDIAYHLLRAFTEGDNSYEAQRSILNRLLLARGKRL